MKKIKLGIIIFIHEEEKFYQFIHFKQPPISTTHDLFEGFHLWFHPFYHEHWL